MRKSAWGVALVAAIFAGAWLYRGDSGVTPEKPAWDARNDVREARRPGVTGVSRSTAAATSARRPMSQQSRLSPLMREFKTSIAYKPLYERIASSPARTPEESWLLAELLERCATNESHKPPAKPATASPDDRPVTNEGPEALKRFAASLSEKDPTRARRIAAFEQARADRCAGLRELKTTDAAIAELRDRAAAAGDPKARVAVLARELFEANKGRVPPAAREISEAQVSAAKELMASGDPDAIQRAASLFWGYSNFSLRAGPEESQLDLGAFSNAWTLVACDLGAVCGPESDYLANACAYQGYCDASSIRDYLFYYMSSPYRSQQLAAYYEGARAASNGDWSYFTAVRGPASSQAMWTYRNAEPRK